MVPLSSFSPIFGHDCRPYGLHRHYLDLQTLVAENLRPRLGFGQLAFPYDTFVRFADTLDPILVLAGTLRQLLGDHINTAEALPLIAGENCTRWPVRNLWSGME